MHRHTHLLIIYECIALLYHSLSTRSDYRILCERMVVKSEQAIQLNILLSIGVRILYNISVYRILVWNLEYLQSFIEYEIYVAHRLHALKLNQTRALYCNNTHTYNMHTHSKRHNVR